MKPMMVFNRTARMITPASITSPIRKAAAAAISNRPIKMSTNCDKNRTIKGVGFFSAISLKPYFSCLFAISSSLSPFMDVLNLDSMSLIKSPQAVKTSFFEVF